MVQLIPFMWFIWKICTLLAFILYRKRKHTELSFRQRNILRWILGFGETYVNHPSRLEPMTHNLKIINQKIRRYMNKSNVTPCHVVHIGGHKWSMTSRYQRSWLSTSDEWGLLLLHHPWALIQWWDEVQGSLWRGWRPWFHSLRETVFWIGRLRQ